MIYLSNLHLVFTKVYGKTYIASLDTVMSVFFVEHHKLGLITVCSQCNQVDLTLSGAFAWFEAMDTSIND